MKTEKQIFFENFKDYFDPEKAGEITIDQFRKAQEAGDIMVDVALIVAQSFTRDGERMNNLVNSTSSPTLG